MKRSFDFVVSLFSLVMLMPLFIVVGILIYRRMGPPVLFRQKRPGMHGHPFELIKFRTMCEAVDQNGVPLEDRQRLTSFGRFLRSTSIDELPELWNVVKGEMSLVGPRPLLMEYLPLYNKYQAQRHDVRPGITGWAQVNGRNAISWDEKFDLDVWYVKNHSLALDLKILWMTVQKVLSRDGISASGEATMTKFTGNGK
jgi:lipopolysaccharide/colanic/teichoic acid biosynthesis glycosyltransferase